MKQRVLPADPEDRSAAFDKALRVLNAAAQTRSGLVAKLRRGGFSAAAADAAAAQAVGLGYVNDAEYARSLVSRRLQQGRGRGLIARELAHKGLEDDVMANAMGAVDPENEAASARQLADRLARRYAGVAEPRRGRERALASMARRGFGSAVSRRALAEAEAALRDPG